MAIKRRDLITGAAALAAHAGLTKGAGARWRIPLGAKSLAPVIVDTTSLVAAYSVIRINGWAGNCLQVRRASDNATKDIGFVGNVVDWAGADSFANGSALTVSKWYDQSGNAKDFTQATGANQPAFTALNNSINSGKTVRPVSCAGIPTGVSQSLSVALTPDRQSVSVYQAVAPRVTFDDTTWFDMTNAGFTTSLDVMFTAQSTLAINAPGTFLSTLTPPARQQIIGYASGSSNQRFRVNGSETTAAATTSSVIGLFNIGRAVAGAQFNGLNDYFCVLIYNTTHSSAQMQAIEAALNASFGTASHTKNLVYCGSSLITGYKETLNQSAAWMSGFGSRLSDVATWEIWNQAAGGRTLAQEFAARAANIALFNSSASKNVFVIDAPSNDINAATITSSSDAQTYANDLFGVTNTGRTTNITVPYINALKAAGFAVVVPTIIARGTFGANQELARLDYNTLVRANAGTFGYATADRASDSRLNSVAATANTTYYDTDTVHTINAGTAIWAPVDKAAILLL